MRLDLEAYDDTTRSYKVLARQVSLCALTYCLFGLTKQDRRGRSVLGICVKEIIAQAEISLKMVPIQRISKKGHLNQDIHEPTHGIGLATVWIWMYEFDFYAKVLSCMFVFQYILVVLLPPVISILLRI